MIGETKSEGPFDADDVRKLGQLADAIPHDYAEAFILFSKTGTFSPEEIALARSLNSRHRQRVILWSRDELEPFYPYERSKMCWAIIGMPLRSKKWHSTPTFYTLLLLCMARHSWAWTLTEARDPGNLSDLAQGNELFQTKKFIQVSAIPPQNC